MMKCFKTFIVLVLLLSITGCQKQDNIAVHIISDLHYAPKDMFEYVGDFKEYCDENGTGKQIEYQDEIFDAFINQELESKPNYIIMTGDLVYSGTYKAHNRFADKFKTLIDNGIQVLVIPGNHDFDYYPFYLENNISVYSAMLKKEEFETIYNSFGYDKALSKDDNSLSYSYKLGSSTLLIALDTLSEYGRADGKLKVSTLNWIEEQLEYAKKHKMNTFFIGHHNVLLHNPMFDEGYRLENDGRLISLMNKYDAKLYISGHMHIQDINKQDSITEILNESFTLWPHRYGELLITGSNYYYEAKSTDVSKYTNSTNDDLLNYDEFGKNFYYNNFYKQIINKRKDKNNISEEELRFYNTEALINGEYFAGIYDETNYDFINNSDLSSSYIKSIVRYLDEDNLKISGTLK